MAVFKGTDRYVILRYLGSGSFGEVYEVFDRERQTKVALKMPHEATAGGLYYFKREFRSLVDVIHPNLAALYELVGDKDQWFFTMELIQGISFKDFLRKSQGSSDSHSSGASMTGLASFHSMGTSWKCPDNYRTASTPCAEMDYEPLVLPPGAESGETGPCSAPEDYNIVRILLRQLTEGLVALHQAGKLHRDIKPSNVLVTPEGHLSILDFGLVVESTRGTRDDKVATRIIGTPAFMSPEQLEGHRGTEASDWYSVGVMLYEVLTGHQPYSGSLLEMMKKKVGQDPPSPSSLVPETPEDLDTLCMRLLQRDPATRPKGTAILDRLKEFRSLGTPRFQVNPAGSPPLLVGRDLELHRLIEAFRAIPSKVPTLVHLHGGSGTGKTLLLRHFVHEIQLREPEAIILQGRCYEQEFVPYKAIDPLIDDLSRYLAHLPKDKAESLTPRNALALTRVFPVLNRIETLIRNADRGLEIEDAKAIRRRAILALRELLGRLSDRHPVILIIDDLHWGDLDSAYLLRELLAPPEPPPLMLVICYRTEESASAPVLLELFSKPLGVEAIEIPVKELAPRLAEDLAISLIGSETPAAEVLAKRIARDSGGNPFFIGELAHHSKFGSVESSDLLENTLYGCIQQRVASLSDEIQRIVETLALAGHPLSWDVIKRASDLEGAHLPPTSLLKAGRLVRTRSTREQQTLEIYHDFVRRAVLSSMGGNRRRAGHLRLAEVLELCGEGEPETLAKHYILAGESRKAAEFTARAADKAAETFAFKGAADLYRRSMDLRPLTDPENPDLMLKLADVLSNAGLGKEAAQTYLLLSTIMEPHDKLRLQRRAAEEFFRSGHFEQGVSTLEPVLASIGMKLASNPFRAKLSATYYAMRLRLRGLGFTERKESEIPAEELERVDIVWTAVQGIGTGAIMRGMDLQVRHLLLALEVGEPSRVIRALAHQIIHESIRGNRASHEIQKFQSTSLVLAERFGDPKLLGYVYLASGTAALRLGRWTSALELLEQAKSVYTQQCVGVTYELHQLHYQQMHAQFVQAQFGEFQERLPALIKDAEERGDLLAEANLKTGYSMFYYLAKNDPEQAQRHVTKALEIWSSTEFHFQHWQALMLQGTINQYIGHPEIAWRDFLTKWPALRESRLLKVQLINIAFQEYRARNALSFVSACPGDSQERREALQIARATMRTIRKENTNYGNTTYYKLKGMETAIEGRKTESVEWFLKAEVAYHDCQMHLHANVMRWCRGVQLGEKGIELVNSAEQWMREHGIVEPHLYVRVHVHDLGRS
jgi:eukaryotic-like serine/threonine-protein kinase